MDGVLDDFDLRPARRLCLGHWGFCGCVRGINLSNTANINSYVVYSLWKFYINCRSDVCRVAESKIAIS